MATRIFLTLDESDFIDDVCVCTEAKNCKDFLTQLFREMPKFYAEVAEALYPGDIDLKATVDAMLGKDTDRVKVKLPDDKTREEILDDITKQTAESVHEIINTLSIEKYVKNQLDVDTIAETGRVVFSDLKNKSLLASFKK